MEKERSPKRFSDFAKDALPLDGAKMRIEDLLNREILVLAYKIKESKYEREKKGQCLTLQFEIDKQRYVLFTGSTILIEQVTRYKEELPFLATIKKIDRYYSFQ
jgi:hypothetical protein